VLEKKRGQSSAQTTEWGKNGPGVKADEGACIRSTTKGLLLKGLPELRSESLDKERQYLHKAD